MQVFKEGTLAKAHKKYIQKQWKQDKKPEISVCVRSVFLFYFFWHALTHATSLDYRFGMALRFPTATTRVKQFPNARKQVAVGIGRRTTRTSPKSRFGMRNRANTASGKTKWNPLLYLVPRSAL
jgi:hypothetical protein